MHGTSVEPSILQLSTYNSNLATMPLQSHSNTVRSHYYTTHWYQGKMAF